MRVHQGEIARLRSVDNTHLSKTHSYHLYTHGEYCLRGELGSVVADYAKHLERAIPNRVSMTDLIALACWAYEHVAAGNGKSAKSARRCGVAVYVVTAYESDEPKNRPHPLLVVSMHGDVSLRRRSSGLLGSLAH